MLLLLLGLAAGLATRPAGVPGTTAPKLSGDYPPREAEDPCAAAALGRYDLGLRVAAIFILLVVSLVGALAPVLAVSWGKGSRAQTAIRLGTYFGCGTVLSTAFIHMLLPASENLSSECLPAVFGEGGYPAWAFLLAVVAILLMQLVDFSLVNAYRAGAGAGKQGAGRDPEEGGRPEGAEDAAATSEEASHACKAHGPGCKSLLAHSNHSAASMQRIVGMYFMEAGVALHSVIIGIPLGAASSGFVPLLVALIFHQVFEGFAISSAAVQSGLTRSKLILLAGIYAITTPVGIAIGIIIHSSFNESAVSTLITMGVIDALSGGILIYVALIELINPMMTQCAWLVEQKLGVKVTAFGSLYAGAAAMAVIGKWA